MPRGRKRKTARRYGNGHIAKPTTRAARRELVDMGRPVREARQRVYDLTAEEAAHQYAVDALGRMALAGQERGGISMTQREAGEKYAEIVATYEMFLAGPKTPTGILRETGGGYDSSMGDEDDYVAGWERAKGRYNRALQAVTMQRDPLALGALNTVVIHDKEEWGLVAHLRTALNAIEHEFRSELLRPKDEDKSG